MSEEESQLHPAAKARDEPNMNPKLDPPNRPVTSFLWLTSPWKTFRYIIWKNYKWYIILAFIIILLIVTIVVFVYTAPVSPLCVCNYHRTHMRSRGKVIGLVCCCCCHHRCHKKRQISSSRHRWELYVCSIYISRRAKNCLLFASVCWTPATSATNRAFLSTTSIIHTYS